MPLSKNDIATRLEHWKSRMTLTRNVAVQGLASLRDDFRLLARRWKGGVVFRQKDINGFQMLVRADEDLGRIVYCLGAYEPDESSYIRQNIKETDICFDIGANVGYYTLLLTSLARKQVVHAFEPVPLNYHLLRTNLLLNGFSNAIVNLCAVGDSDGEAEFVVAKDGAFSSFIDTGRKPALAKTRVSTMTVDHYCEHHQIPRADFLKVDVEGAEGRVIAGAARLLSDRNRRPRLVMLELYEPMLCTYGSNINQILSHMRAHGYCPFVYCKGETLPFARKHYNNFVNVFFLFDQGNNRDLSRTP